LGGVKPPKTKLTETGGWSGWIKAKARRYSSIKKDELQKCGVLLRGREKERTRRKAKKNKKLQRRHSHEGKPKEYTIPLGNNKKKKREKKRNVGRQGGGGPKKTRKSNGQKKGKM